MRLHRAHEACAAVRTALALASDFAPGFAKFGFGAPSEARLSPGAAPGCRRLCGDGGRVAPKGY